MPASNISAPTVLEIDLAAIADNIRLVRERSGSAALAAVVKANAYGLGLAEIARVHVECGTKTFFVATLDEGIALRQHIGAGFEIAVLNPLSAITVADYTAHDLTPVLNTMESITRWTDPAPVILHFDTGMNRLGLDADETAAILARPELTRHLNITVVMSHFACSDEPDNPMNAAQNQRFARIAAQFPAARKSMSNSGGIFASTAYHYDLVRSGQAIYGLNPGPGPNPMRPVVRLRARVLQTRQVRAGETAGYGATWTAREPRRLATLGLGYADGLPRCLGERGQVFWNDIALPLAGRVSMDLMTLDATNAPDLRPGDWVDILGPHQDADALAALTGTIGYEILTGLGRRYHRVYSR